MWRSNKRRKGIWDLVVELQKVFGLQKKKHIRRIWQDCPKLTDLKSRHKIVESHGFHDSLSHNRKRDILNIPPTSRLAHSAAHIAETTPNFMVPGQLICPAWLYLVSFTAWQRSQLTWLATGFATGLPVGLQHDPGTNWMIWEIAMVPKSAVLHYQPRKELWWLYCLFFSRTACPTHQVGKKNVQITTYNIYIPESSKGVKFVPLNHQKQTWGMKFDTLGGSRYILYTCILLYFPSIRKGYPPPGFAISFLANSICTIKTLNNFKEPNTTKSKQTNSFYQEGRMESHHETYKHFQSSIHDGRSYCTEHGHHTAIHVHKRKRLISSIKCQKNFHRPSPSILYQKLQHNPYTSSSCTMPSCNSLQRGFLSEQLADQGTRNPIGYISHDRLAVSWYLAVQHIACWLVEMAAELGQEAFYTQKITNIASEKQPHPQKKSIYSNLRSTILQLWIN